MGTLLASALIASARITLLDPDPGVTWSNGYLLIALAQGQRNACLLRPELYTVRAAIPMAAGTLQAIPEDGTAFMRLDENVDGGLRCRLVEPSLLDVAARFWPAATPEKAVQEYAHDARDRKRFHVLPPNDGTGSVVALYGALPPAPATVNDPIALDDIYEVPLVHFMLSEAYAANTKRQDVAKTQFYRQSFERQLGVNAQSTLAVLPKLVAAGGT